MKYLLARSALGLSLLAATPASAAEEQVIPKPHVTVLGCLEGMEVTTSWPQCVELMFQPCVKEEVGSETHAACLGNERKGWVGTVETLQSELLDAIQPSAAAEVADIMGQWTGYVVQKCEEVARSKGAAGESARLGCEISEMAGLSGEFAACLEGRSSAQYCVLKE